MRTELNIWSKVSTNTSKAWSLGANCFICRLPVGCYSLGVCEELHASLAVPVHTDVLMHYEQTDSLTLADALVLMLMSYKSYRGMRVAQILT